MHQIRGRLYFFEGMQPGHSRFGLAEERTAGGTLLAMSVKAPLRGRSDESVQRVGQHRVKLGTAEPRWALLSLELVLVFHVKLPVC